MSWQRIQSCSVAISCWKKRTTGQYSYARCEYGDCRTTSSEHLSVRFPACRRRVLYEKSGVRFAQHHSVATRSPFFPSSGTFNWMEVLPFPFRFITFFLSFLLSTSSCHSTISSSLFNTSIPSGRSTERREEEWKRRKERGFEKKNAEEVKATTTTKR